MCNCGCQQQQAGPRGLPAQATLLWIKTSLEVLLLLLAVPWIIRELARNPADVSRRAATKHLKGA